jgi:putative CocE/NonD family hydrolase
MDAVDHGLFDLREPGELFVDPRRDADTTLGFLERHLAAHLPFFDRFLRGREPYDPPPVRWRLAHAGWRGAATWPPAGSAPVDWHLAGANALAFRPDRRPTEVAWEHRPAQPVPSLAHPYYRLVDPPDDRRVEGRADVLSFTSEPLTAPLDLAGPVQLALSISSTAPSTHVMARLLDVRPDGRTVRILDGAARAERPGPAEVAIDLGHTGYRMRPGHRLGVQIASSEFPRYVLHPGTDAEPWTATAVADSEQRIVIGGPCGARLRCFVLGDADAPP